MNLRPHQQRLAHNYTGPNLLAWEAGTGKTIGAIAWLKDGRDADALVICPKQVVEKWQQELKKWGARGTVISKEQFLKQEYMPRSAVVIDEADEFASPLFIPKLRSNRSEYLYEYLRQYPKMPRLLLTATPVRSTPWNLHTLLVFLGHYVPYKKWQTHFFELARRPYLPRPAWLPKKGWQKMMQRPVQKYADIVLMHDCVDDLPPEQYETLAVKTPPFVAQTWEPAQAFVEEHKWEQQNKVGAIKEIARGYRKVLVVAHYVEQVETLAHELGKERETFYIYGKTKDQEGQIRAAQESSECYFIVQASIGAGFDADTFSCMIFASMSFKVRDYVQMKARIRRIHNLHPVIYYSLHGGRIDKRVYETIETGKDFVPSYFTQETQAQRGKHHPPRD